MHEEEDHEKILNNFNEIELVTIERRHMFEVATVLNIAETSNTLKFLHSINATNLKNLINRYIHRLTIQENRRNIPKTINQTYPKRSSVWSPNNRKKSTN